MIVPTDYNLLENVSFYDPVSQRIFFKKDFWQSFFPRLRYDFKNTYGFLPPDMSSFVRDVKTKIFQYYYKKFILEEKTSSLYGEIDSVFTHHREKEDWSLEHRTARVLERQDTATTLVQVGRPASPTFVDGLLDHFAALEIRSSRELSLQVTFDEFARQYESESDGVRTMLADYESGKLANLLACDDGFAGLLITAKDLSKRYQCGIATTINAMDVSDDGLFDNTQTFSIDRFHFFDKRHSSNEVYRALIERIGREKALFIYENFMLKGKFYYQDEAEYVYSCFVGTALCDLAEYASKRKFNSFWMGKIKRSQLKKDKSSASLNFANSSSSWRKTSDSDEMASPASVFTSSSAFSTSSKEKVKFGDTAKFGKVDDVGDDVSNLSPFSTLSSPKSAKSFGSDLGSERHSFGSGTSKWSGFGGSANPR